MKLIGMFDSPYVRRVAISLQLLGLRFEHQSLSVFRTFDQFHQINPVVKSPTLVCDDGSVLMDSNLMLEYAYALAQEQGQTRKLLPSALPDLLTSLRVIGLALAAAEKGVQIVYEHKVRPADKLYAPWLERVTGQMQAALRALEHELTRQALSAQHAEINQAGISVAVTWDFIQQMLPDLAPVAEYPNVAKFSAEAELLPEFRAAPYGDATYQSA